MKKFREIESFQQHKEKRLDWDQGYVSQWILPAAQRTG